MEFKSLARNKTWNTPLEILNDNHNNASALGEQVHFIARNLIYSAMQLHRQEYIHAYESTHALSEMPFTIIETFSDIRNAILKNLARRLIIIATDSKEFVEKVKYIFNRNVNYPYFATIVQIKSECDEYVRNFYNLSFEEDKATVIYFDGLKFIELKEISVSDINVDKKIEEFVKDEVFLYQKHYLHFLN